MKGMGPLMLEVSSNDSGTPSHEWCSKLYEKESWRNHSMDNRFEIFNGYQVYVSIIYLGRVVIND